LGQVEKSSQVRLPAYDPKCYLCPGNTRSEGARNPDYVSTFTFDNDFPALLPPDPQASPQPEQAPLFRVEPENGICRVVCFSPRHDLTLPEMTQFEVEAVVREWTRQENELSQQDFVRYVQIFENKGAMMGCSMPHPHSQVWATGHIPNEPAKELIAQTGYHKEKGSCLLCDYLQEEIRQGDRIIVSNPGFTALAPFWAVWPFEALVVANRHLNTLQDLKGDEPAQLADILRALTIRYDNLFEVSFPYSMGFHPQPNREKVADAWHFHGHFYPPLLRSATVRKFMVGYEMLGMPQRDITAETAAEKLRSLPNIHYKQAS
jgi:UDPglucose--hexose-1-phosphate uridylyltransferase